jgi:hypothetical protein
MGNSLGILLTAVALTTGSGKVVPGTGVSATVPGQTVGYVYLTEANCPQKVGLPYVPREGDLIFFDDRKEFWDYLYYLGQTSAPFHVGIVIKRPDGHLAVLESGPDDTLNVKILDVSERMHGFMHDFQCGNLQVRQCKEMLTPEQSKALTDFAVKNEGKKYAWMRLLMQGTYFRKRGAWFTESYATTYLNRKSWLCCEIVVAAAHLVGLIDGKVVRAEITYPMDIVDDHRYDLSPNYTPPAYWAPTPLSPPKPCPFMGHARQ